MEAPSSTIDGLHEEGLAAKHESEGGRDADGVVSHEDKTKNDATQRTKISEELFQTEEVAAAAGGEAARDGSFEEALKAEESSNDSDGSKHSKELFSSADKRFPQDLQPGVTKFEKNDISDGIVVTSSAIEQKMMTEAAKSVTDIKTKTNTNSNTNSNINPIGRSNASITTLVSSSQSFVSRASLLKADSRRASCAPSVDDINQSSSRVDVYRANITDKENSELFSEDAITQHQPQQQQQQPSDTHTHTHSNSPTPTPPQDQQVIIPEAQIITFEQQMIEHRAASMHIINNSISSTSKDNNGVHNFTSQNNAADAETQAPTPAAAQSKHEHSNQDLSAHADIAENTMLDPPSLQPQQTDLLVVATPTKSKSQKNKSKKYIISATLFLLVVIIAVVTSIIISKRNNQNYDDNSNQNSGSSSNNDDSANPTTTTTTTTYDDSTFLAGVPQTICLDRIPGQGFTRYCTPEDTIEQGGGSCNLVAQSFLDQVPSAQICIQNSGACRKDIREGLFYGVNATALLPFKNRLMTLQMTGLQIVVVLEQAMERAFGPDLGTGSYPYAAGIRFHVNATAPNMERLTNVQINPRLQQSTWEPINHNQVYTVVANSYIAFGEDGYDEFGAAMNLQQAKADATTTFVEYALQQEILLDPPKETYSTQSFIPIPDD